MAKRRTAAQKRATAKLVAFNRSRRRLSNPTRKRRRLRRNPITKAAAYRAVPTIARANPIRRRRRRGTSVAVRRRRIRHNPLRLGGGGIFGQLMMPAATAAVGALALDVAFGYLPLPANLRTGPLQLVTKTVGAIGLTFIASKVVSKSTAQAMGVGALTVVFHDVMKSFIVKTMPTLKMDGLGYYSAGYPVGGYDGMAGMGEYIGNLSGGGMPMPGNQTMMGEYVSGLSRVDNESQYYGGNSNY